MNPYIIIAILFCVIVVLFVIVYLQFFKKTDNDLMEEIDLLEMENRNNEMKVIEVKEWKKKADDKIRRNNNHNHNSVESLIMDEDMPAWMND